MCLIARSIHTYTCTAEIAYVNGILSHDAFDLREREMPLDESVSQRMLAPPFLRRRLIPHRTTDPLCAVMLRAAGCPDLAICIWKYSFFNETNMYLVRTCVLLHSVCGTFYHQHALYLKLRKGDVTRQPLLYRLPCAQTICLQFPDTARSEPAQFYGALSRLRGINVPQNLYMQFHRMRKSALKYLSKLLLEILASMEDNAQRALRLHCDFKLGIRDSSSNQAADVECSGVHLFMHEILLDYVFDFVCFYCDEVITQQNVASWLQLL